MTSALFGDEYAYFSSFAATWVRHVERYVDRMVAELRLNERSHVVEVASNDGYLLQFVVQRGIPCTGIEPTASTAAVARARGVRVINAFFGTSLATELAAGGAAADLMVANNVLAHVPDINDFVAGFARLLAPNGVATFEFPHVARLIEGCQFDTIYHEHFSYLSLTTVERIFAACGLSVFDVEELPTHGGSLRVFAQRADTGERATRPTVTAMLEREEEAGLLTSAYYSGFQKKVDRIRDDFRHFLSEAHRRGRVVVAYGAAAKGSTLMNYAGVGPSLIPFVADRSPAKQGLSMPGSRIPIVGEEALREARPPFVVLLPWNLREELVEQLSYVRLWGGKLLTAVPQIQFLT